MNLIPTKASSGSFPNHLWDKMIKAHEKLEEKEFSDITEDTTILTTGNQEVLKIINKAGISIGLLEDLVINQEKLKNLDDTFLMYARLQLFSENHEKFKLNDFLKFIDSKKIMVMDIAKEAGFNRLAIATEPR